MAHAAGAAGHDPSRVIPLRCLICPKRPNFSDVSHLLTHVASKGHLAQHFKTSVRASTDTAARDALGHYNDWFKRYGIERLCANRLKSKESKKGRIKNDPEHLLPRVLIPSPPLSTALGSTDLGDHARRINAGYASSSSFQLPQSSPTVDSSVFSESLDLPPSWGEQASLREPRLHLWLTDHERLHYAPRPVVGSPLASASAAMSSVPPSSVSGGKSTGPAGVGAVPPDQTSFCFPLDCMISNGSTPAAAGTECGDDTSEQVDAEKLDGDCQLKGVLWPGMDIFDSAPPEMKRQRNQKKDGSVIAQMQRNSALVRPTELIFWPSGDLKKERWIYSPTDSDFSEIAGGRAMGRKRPVPTARAPLQDVSANVPRGVASSAATAKMGGRAGELRRESRKTSRQAPKVMTTTVTATTTATPAAANTSTTTGTRKMSGRQGGQAGSDMHRPIANMVPSDVTGDTLETLEALEALEALEPPEKRSRRGVASELDDFFRGLHRRPPSPSPTDAPAALGGFSSVAAPDTVGTESQPPSAGHAASDRASQPEITSFFKPLLSRHSGKEKIPFRSSVVHCSRQAVEKREMPTEPQLRHSPPSMNVYSPQVDGQHDPVDFVGFGDASLFEYPTPALTMNGFGGHGHQPPCVTRPEYTMDPALFTTDAGDWKVFSSGFPFADEDDDGGNNHRAGLPTDDDMLFRGDRR
ncbi:MAG: hypothetical protein M1815_005929 [Lichina confinis]|nr:MAG: hypothetical protein M1815_005929 [Lichina confinis]